MAGKRNHGRPGKDVCLFDGVVYCECIRLFSAKYVSKVSLRHHITYYGLSTSLSMLWTSCMLGLLLQTKPWVVLEKREVVHDDNRSLSINNKISLRKWSCATSNFKFFSSSLKCWQFFWIWILKDCIEVQEKKKESRLVFKSSTKREIRHFHVIVMQWQKRNVQKSMMHMQYCCFANFSPLSLHCRHRCLSSLITPETHQKMLTTRKYCMA